MDAGGLPLASLVGLPARMQLVGRELARLSKNVRVASHQLLLQRVRYRRKNEQASLHCEAPRFYDESANVEMRAEQQARAAASRLDSRRATLMLSDELRIEATEASVQRSDAESVKTLLDALPTLIAEELSNQLASTAEGFAGMRYKEDTRRACWIAA